MKKMMIKLLISNHSYLSIHKNHKTLEIQHQWPREITLKEDLKPNNLRLNSWQVRNYQWILPVIPVKNRILACNLSTQVLIAYGIIPSITQPLCWTNSKIAIPLFQSSITVPRSMISSVPHATVILRFLIIWRKK